MVVTGFFCTVKIAGCILDKAVNFGCYVYRILPRLEYGGFEEYQHNTTSSQQIMWYVHKTTASYDTNWTKHPESANSLAEADH